MSRETERSRRAQARGCPSSQRPSLSGATASPQTSRAPRRRPSAASSPTTATHMKFKNDNGSYSGWYTYATSKAWTLVNTQGTRTVTVQYKDSAGNTSSTDSDTIIFDSQAPTSPSITINGGSYTTSTSVTLATSATNANYIKYNNDNGTYSGW